MKRMIFVAGVLAVLATPANAQITIGTDTPAPGGGHALATQYFFRVGQIFTAPDLATTMSDFGFWLYPGTSIDYTAHVFEWTGSGLGAEIFSSALLTATPTELTLFSVDVTGASVVAGQQYVAFFHAVSNAPGTYVGARTGVNLYDGGSMYLDHRVTGIEYGGISDVYFQANFNGGAPTEVVPEPITMVLLGSGLFGVGAAARRRHREHDTLA